MKEQGIKDNTRFYTFGLTTKLQAVNLLLSALVFGSVSAIVFYSYFNISTMLTETIVQDVDENIGNAGLLKDLSTVFADTSLLVGTFYKNEQLLRDKGNNLVEITQDIEKMSTYGPLKGALKDFSVQLRILFDQCTSINLILRQAEKFENELKSSLSSLEKTVSDKKVAQILANENPIFLKQLGVVITGYRETLLQINILFLQTSSGLLQPAQVQPDASVISLIDDLGLRFQTLTASEPQIAAYSSILEGALKNYRDSTLQMFAAAHELEIERALLEAAEGQLITVMEELDERISSSTKKMRRDISVLMQSAGAYILITFAIVFIARSIIFFFFILSNIKKPMSTIENGIEAIRAGDLSTHITLNRNDEWSNIESTLNRMTADLQSSYTELQDKNIMLEATQHQLEEKVNELTMQSEARKRLEEQLLHAQKMEAIGQLAGGIAHDFNNILSVVIGYAHLLKMKTQQQTELQTYSDQVLAASMRAKNLTKNLLTFSRKQITIAAPVNVNEIISNIKNMLERLIREDIELNILLAKEELTIQADTGQIEQILINLATNARDAMAESGSLSIETSLTTISGKYTEDHLFIKEGRHACISVTDTGTGMGAKAREKIFEPFFTTKEIGKGTGLGLSTVYGIIKQHNGTINVYSEPGLGTTFRMYFPLIGEKAQEVLLQESPEPQGGTETILLAEDDADVRNLTDSILTEAGYTVLVAIDGEDAIKVFSEHVGEVQLVLLDVIMPKMNGKEVSDWIMKTSPDVKVLFMSGYSVDLIFKKGILEDGLELITKPAAPDELLLKIREVLDKKSDSPVNTVDER